MSAISEPAPLRLEQLSPGQVVVYGGDRYTTVDADLAEAFRPGDRLIVDPSSGALLHVPADAQSIATAAVDAAIAAFAGLAACSDDQVTQFFEAFADLLADADALAAIRAANAGDVARAADAGRSTTRLELSESMWAGMIAGLRGWAESPLRRDAPIQRVDHEGWSVEARRAPLGVVGFVFEGRPNVFADAAGVVRTGNTVVFRIGSDALATAEAITRYALRPALERAGLPPGTVSLVASASRAAGWALLADRRLALAVARGSGAAVAQLGAVARQAGIPVSLHGTGGAWLVADDDADAVRFASSVVHSLDRKVCNTLNVCCIVESRAADLVPAFLAAVRLAAEQRGVGGRVHVTPAASEWLSSQTRAERSKVVRADGAHDEPFVSSIGAAELAREWEWERSPEVSLHVVTSLDEAIAAFNAYSPRFIASLISDSSAAHERFFAAIDAPFVGDGFTRWVDGHYALDTPELGLSNWEGGRLLGRGGILSGDGVHTVRYRATVSDTGTHR
jgi:glutamate-5-semialdehyde dehydrogenase